MSRPHTVEEQADQQPDCELCMYSQKIESALSIVSMFLDSTRLVVIEPDVQGNPRGIRRPLEPKECAAYNAALNFLECYMDSDL